MKKYNLFSPPNVWLHDEFESGFNGSKLDSWLLELGFPDNWDLAVMGVPEEEQISLNETALGYIAEYNPGNIFAESDVLESLGVDGQIIEYSGQPSRDAVLTELEDIRDPENNLAILTTSYNVPRTSYEASEKLEMNGLEDGYTMNFTEFPSMEVSPLRGTVAGAISFLLDKRIGPQRAFKYRSLMHTEDFFGPQNPKFEYELPELEQPCYLVLGDPLDETLDYYSFKIDEERFKLNRYPGFQNLKDKAKKPARRIFDQFDY